MVQIHKVIVSVHGCCVCVCEVSVRVQAKSVLYTERVTRRECSCTRREYHVHGGGVCAQ